MSRFTLSAQTGQTDSLTFPVRGEGGRFVPAKKERPAAAATDAGSAGAQLAALVQSLAAGVSPADLDVLRDDLAAVAARVELLESAKPARVEFKVGDVVGKAVEGARAELTELVEAVAAGFQNLWLTGPKGSGKSTMGEHLAAALGRSFGAVSLNGDRSTRNLLGGLGPDGKYNESEFVRIFEHGGVFMIDEVDAGDPNILLVLNAPLANGLLFIPDHPDPARRVIRRHKDCVIVCAANTWGHGATREYCGRSQLDGAFLDRFQGAEFFIDYSRDLEERICDDRALLNALWSIREKCQSHKVRAITTRSIIAAAKWRAAGKRQSDIVAKLTVSWTAEEKAKCL